MHSILKLCSFGLLLLLYTWFVPTTFCDKSTDVVLNKACTTEGASDPDGGSVPDCNCRVNSVDYAVRHLISPILSNLTSKPFFRYFKVDLETPCPFWNEEGLCMMEGCSVCTCDEDEIPKTWLKAGSHARSSYDNGYGWITSGNSSYGFGGEGLDDSLGRIEEAQHTEVSPEAAWFENDDDDSDEWTVLHSDKRPKSTSGGGSIDFTSYQDLYSFPVEPSSAEAEVADTVKTTYVNLLQNPERFTGYTGPSAARVWRSIQEENCFGDLTDVCMEKRIFYRLMSGLQSSISTHIAKEYLHPNGSWGTHHPLYWKAVGSHPDRLNNMYFAFLFVLRSVVKAQHTILSYPYNTGNAAEDAAVKELLSAFFIKPSVSPHSSSNRTRSDSNISSNQPPQQQQQSTPSLYGWTEVDSAGTGVEAVEECRYGFDESEMFQVSALLNEDDGKMNAAGRETWNTFEEKQLLREEFMTKFRNISRIMDCVTCEKCRLWGKLQILGVGTAIKILLTPTTTITPKTATTATTTTTTGGVHGATSTTSAGTGAGASADASETPSTVAAVEEETCRPGEQQRLRLNRQEIIALLNTLNQFSKSIEFAADASDLVRQQEGSGIGIGIGIGSGIGSGGGGGDDAIASTTTKPTTTTTTTTVTAADSVDGGLQQQVESEFPTFLPLVTISMLLITTLLAIAVRCNIIHFSSIEKC